MTDKPIGARAQATSGAREVAEALARLQEQLEATPPGSAVQLSHGTAAAIVSLAAAGEGVDLRQAKRLDSGLTLDDHGRRVADGWDHDGDLIASLQGDLARLSTELGRAHAAGDALAGAASRVRLVNGCLRGIDALNDAASSWGAIREDDRPDGACCACGEPHGDEPCGWFGSVVRGGA